MTGTGPGQSRELALRRSTCFSDSHHPETLGLRVSSEIPGGALSSPFRSGSGRCGPTARGSGDRSGPPDASTACFYPCPAPPPAPAASPWSTCTVNRGRGRPCWQQTGQQRIREGRARDGDAARVPVLLPRRAFLSNSQNSLSRLLVHL